MIIFLFHTSLRVIIVASQFYYLLTMVTKEAVFDTKYRTRLIEPPHDKTNIMTAPSEDSDQLGHPPSLSCPHKETLGP